MPDAAATELLDLVTLFYDSPEELAEFEETAAEAMPATPRKLLAHNNHMTVTVESFHESPVDVRVLDKRVTDRHYARKILLSRQTDGRVVQFGVMRIKFDTLQDEVRDEIISESTPLGRILINHNVLRQVELNSLWKVSPGDELRELLDMSSGEITYGRTALIQLDGEPAVELLEIVTL